MHKTLSVGLFGLALLLLSGCRKQEACDAADSRAVCEQFQQCLRSDTSTEVCRTAEKDANKLDQGDKH